MKDKALAKNKIEAIYPLSNMQTALLFHHFTEKVDQGFLNVQCIIDGNLDIDLLKKSWNLTISRHAVLRTSVHWEKIKSPMQIVTPSSKMNWTILDWSDSPITEQSKMLYELNKKNKENGISFQKNPLSNVSLIKIKSNAFQFIWCCHHLLLDGWSSSIILKDVFTNYDALTTNKTPVFEPIPSYKSYLNWQKKKDTNSAKLFWKTTFKDFSSPFLFNSGQQKIKTLVQNNIELSEETSLKVQELAKTYRTTLNTLFQAIWSLVISKYSNSYDIVYGNTVSGRSSDFPNIELMSGMFSNVLPIRTRLDSSSSIKDWVKNLQLQQLEARTYEHNTINEITEWIATNYNTLFDSLFIFENFPWEDIKAGNIKVHSSNSGITSTYPLTLTIKPGKSVAIHLLSDVSLFSSETNDWILNRFEEIINILDINEGISVETLIKQIAAPIYTNTATQSSKIEESTKSTVVPKTETEFKLLKIWKALLHNQNISTEDNFFIIGGNSILSLQIISSLKKLNIIISPNDLFQNQTIKELANFIDNKKENTNSKKHSFNHIINVKSSGNLSPLFCIHGGGRHFFFYNTLSSYLNPNRPVYAIQASGTEGNIILHNSIEDMAKRFLEEIKMVAPNGPYHIMGYCFSTAVALEICRIFKKENQSANLIIADTIAMDENRFAPSKTKRRVKGFFNRLKANPYRAIYRYSKTRYDLYLKPILIKIKGSKIEKKIQKLRDNLAENYLKYQWAPYNDYISLLITEKSDPTLGPEIIESWKEISNKELRILPIKGYHSALFKEPIVSNTAKEIEKCIDLFENNINETA